MTRRRQRSVWARITEDQIGDASPAQVSTSDRVVPDDHDAIRRIHEEKWPQTRRETYNQSHPDRFAGHGLTFPIEDEEDVKHAVTLHGHADNPEQVKANIKRIAKDLGYEHALPEDWREDNESGDDDDGTNQIANDAGTRMQEGRLTIEGHILEGQNVSKTGHEIRVTIIRGGKSNNGFVYDQAALQQIARFIEGAQAYADHNTSVPVRSVHDMVGFYHDAEYVPQDSREPNGRVDATLHILEAADWLWSIIHEAVQLGRPDLIGLSIDVFGNWQQAANAKHVIGVNALNSCDIVTRPSAGGSFQRIIHSQNRQGVTPMPDPIPGSQQTDANQNTPPAQNNAAPGATDPKPAQMTQANTPNSRLLEQQLEQMNQLKAQREAVDEMFQQIKLERSALTLERRLIESILPDPVKRQIREKFVGRIFEDDELDREMTSALQMMADLTKQGIIRDHGYERAATGEQITEAEKLQVAFDLMFETSDCPMLDDSEKSKFRGVKAFTSIREAYARITGDANVTGSSVYNPGTIRVSEHAPIARITEADTTTASFSYLLGTSMNKRLLKDYQAWPAEWQKFCTIAPIKDFKQQTRVRFGHFGSLSTVAEDTAYSTISLTDTAATYVPTKRGNLVTVSRETIINDDLMAIKQIPTKLAVAAAYTLAEFVYTFLSSNPTIYDGSALFINGAPHNNLGTSALSSASMQSGVTAMREQTNIAGKRIGLRPKYLVVPVELEFTAMVVTKSAGVPGSANNDINPMLGYVTPIVSPQLTDTSKWYMVADPRIIDTIEIGFVGGQVNPALFIQDQPLFGLNFTQDVISYKIRHEYGGAIMDFRGFYRGI